jgi:GDP-L-fucose synthase
MTSFWDSHTFIVTGSGGFLGKYIVKKLKERGVSAGSLILPLHKEYDLTDIDDIAKVYQIAEYQIYSNIKKKIIVIHLAAKVGGIGFNLEKPAELFYDNMMMGIQLMDEARYRGVEKFVQIGTTCSYPKHTLVPFIEEDLWNGYPEETNAPYGIAKKALLTMGQAYRQQYGFNSIHLIPVNLYGPGDNFKPESSHVIPALIKKFVDARNDNKPSVTIWGNGSPTREFLYVEDCAEAILLATEKYNSGEPVNLGSGKEISILDLVDLIKELTQFKGQVVWDISKPNGQPRRRMNVSRAKNEFGFEATTDFKEGLLKTIDYYEGTLK